MPRDDPNESFRVAICSQNGKPECYTIIMLDRAILMKIKVVACQVGPYVLFRLPYGYKMATLTYISEMVLDKRSHMRSKVVWCSKLDFICHSGCHVYNMAISVIFLKCSLF